MTMDIAAAAPGFYGKVPELGDFVSRRLPRVFLDPWDAWLQQVIATSREQLGEGWLDVYLTSPIWRFALSPGICGERPWLGVVMPSVDRVGRYYPMTLGSGLRENDNAFAAFSRNRAWFERLEELALSCLQDGFEVETFDARVQELGRAQSETGPDSVPGDIGDAGSGVWQLDLPSLDTLPALYPKLLDKLLGELHFAYSLWWTSGSERVAPSFLICQGLPPNDRFAAFLDGDWHRWGWRERDSTVSDAGVPDSADDA